MAAHQGLSGLDGTILSRRICYLDNRDHLTFFSAMTGIFTLDPIGLPESSPDANRVVFCDGRLPRQVCEVDACLQRGNLVGNDTDAIECEPAPSRTS